jgi:DNA-binding FadR family transcriptional regulator
MPIPSTPGVSSRRGLHRVVVHHLGLRIVRGELGAGATLPTEADLSTELGVSRTVIREAIKILAAKGLVESRPKTGTRALGRTNRAHRLVVEAIERADPAGARESMEALIAFTAREAGRVITAADVDGRSATGRNT